MKKLLTTLLTMVLSLALSSLCSTAATIRVPADYPTIQAGIDAAADDDTVLLADGTYAGPGNFNIVFREKTITLRSENGPENCIIDARGEGTNTHNGLIILEYPNKDIVVDGLTITGGMAYGGILVWGGLPHRPQLHRQ